MTAGVECRSRSADETRAIGEAVGALMRPGDVVALSGDLGAGKTCFVQGAARALGVTSPVTSPSFILMREYQGDLSVVHIDVYRLDHMQELVDIGFEELLDPSRVVFIEWGDAVERMLPESHLDVEIRLDPSDETGRTIAFRPNGETWIARASDLARTIEPWRGAA
jgi:tRNA threonylcarbamoyladenosine biosynthesis protein TsaE